MVPVTCGGDLKFCKSCVSGGFHIQLVVCDGIYLVFLICITAGTT